MRIAVIGAGRWGRNLIANFKKCAVVAAVCHSGSSETTQWLKDNHPEIPVRTLDEILTDTSIDAVAIATPPKAHKEIACKALRIGKDVFVEKPAGDSVQDTNEIQETAKKFNRMLMVGYVFLYHPAWKEIKTMLSKRSERVRALSFDWRKWGTFETKIERDLLCHDIALTLSVRPDLTSCDVVAANDDELFARLMATGTLLGTSHINRKVPGKRKSVVVEGDKGSVFLWENSDLFEYTAKGLVQLPISAQTALETECQVFIDALKTRENPQTSGEFALRVSQLLP